MNRPPLRPVLANAFRLRCPNCRKGKLFRGLPNRMFRNCPVCGLSFYRESGYYLGGMIITYVTTAFILLICYVLSLLLPIPWQFSETTEFVFWLVFAISLTLLLVRPAYSLWLSMDFWIGPWKPGDSK